MSRKRRYETIPKPTWPCPYCGLIHYLADLVRLDPERLQCCQCGQVFTPAKVGDSPSMGDVTFLADCHLKLCCGHSRTVNLDLTL
jgi:rubredoxin